MVHHRLLCLWFPRLGVERLMRREDPEGERPVATVAGHRGAQVLDCVSRAAEALGLRPGQRLRDATAIHPDLILRPRDPSAEAAFLAALRRWADRFGPRVAEDPPDTLVVDVTGCAHLFGGEEAMVARAVEEATDMGLTVHAGLADTPGAAWALTRHSDGRGPPPPLSGDAIDQEARATRSRAAKRGPAIPPPLEGPVSRIAPPGETWQSVGNLPVAALRLEPATVAELSQLGLRRISDLVAQPRAGLSRRFGQPMMDRLDKVLGMAPDPIAPRRPDARFAVRMTLPEPVGLEEDVMAAVDRLLPALFERLAAAGRGARRVLLEMSRTDRDVVGVDVALARTAQDADVLRPLLAMRVARIDAGYGIDALRIEVLVSEPVRTHQDALAGDGAAAPRDTAMADLIGRLGTRIGPERITRLHPVDTHIPEKAHREVAAAFSAGARAWPPAPVPRPLLIWPPEPVGAPARPVPPERFRWRGRDMALARARGPERIAPEWWLDDPAWRTGTRDYWRATCESGEILWLYYAHGKRLRAGWFCQGSFC